MLHCNIITFNRNALMKVEIHATPLLHCPFRFGDSALPPNMLVLAQSKILVNISKSAGYS